MCRPIHGRSLAARKAAKRSEELETERRRYAAAVDDVFRIYDIRMVRREAVDGHDTIFATLTPKPDARPQTDDGKVMRHFKARAWISESDYELVRVEIEAIDDLSFGLGLLARVHKGTVATYERRKVDESWLPKQVTWTASARVLLVRRCVSAACRSSPTTASSPWTLQRAYTPPSPDSTLRKSPLATWCVRVSSPQGP